MCIRDRALVLPSTTIAAIQDRAPSIERSTEVLSGNLDPSSQARIDESLDVLDEYGLGSPFLWIGGHGHGASYTTNRASFAVEEGEQFHSVHVGPFRMLLRYGFIGFFGYFAVAIRLLHRALKDHHNFGVAEMVSVGILVESIFFNPLIVGPVAAPGALFVGAALRRAKTGTATSLPKQNGLELL